MAAAAVIGAASLVFHSSVRANQESAARTTASGVYTDAQAKRGEALYTQRCAGCHGPDLLGEGQAPSLVGKDFDAEWTGQSMDDLFQRTSVGMPADAPGTLKPSEIADVIAFMLSKGHSPAGQTDLPSDAAALTHIKYVAPAR
jgi:mono/diheme cytochrome c family protein